MSASKIVGGGLALIAATALAACGPEPIPQTKADTTYAQQVKLSPPPPDKARLYALLGRERGGLIAYKNDTVADVQINSLRVGALNSNECLVMDLVPGTYIVTITDLRTNSISQQAYKLVPGQAKIIALDLQRNMARDIFVGAAFGVIGVAATQGISPSPSLIVDRSAEGLAVIQNLTITSPDAATLATIRPQESR